MYIALIIALLILGIVFYFLLDKEILSPTIITISMFILCTIFAFTGRLSWNDTDISINVILIIVLGILSFGIGESISRLMPIKGTKKETNESETNNKVIKIETWKIIAVTLFIFITIFFTYTEIIRISDNVGVHGSFSQRMSAFREASTLFNANAIEEGNSINTIVSQMKKVCDILCVVLIYIIINNFIYKKNIEEFINEDILLITPVFLCLLLSVLTGGRGLILRFIIAAILILLILLMKKESSKDIFKKTIKIGVTLLIIIIPIFYLSLPLLGRKTSKGIVEYTTFYFGCSIPSFEEFLNNPPEHDGHFGSESLYGIQTILYRLKLTDYINPISREWTTFEDQNGSEYNSNIYTCFRRYYYDFGITGVVVCSLIFGFVFHKLYECAKEKENPMYLIFYASYGYMLIDQIRDELFFTRFININTIINIILVITCTYFFINFDYEKMRLKLLNIGDKK